ncbi:hypothetical protein, partial [Paenibacillus alginolyticus]|uniref:hypothetical protein n=1 Tax=Paenibacillus alginolyticus TaxID=59839 RepID=UPI001C263F23
IEVLKGQIQQKEDIDHFGRCLLFVNGPQFKLKRLVLQWPPQAAGVFFVTTYESISFRYPKTAFLLGRSSLNGLDRGFS